MKRISYYPALVFFTVMIVWSCAEDVENFTLPEAFADYESWTLLEEYTGSQLSGAAHGSKTRKIFINQNNNELEADGELPIGTRLVKEIDGGKEALVGMVKKSKGSNSWDYWDLKAGINLGAVNDCQSCHETATTDYAFSIDDL